MSNEEQQQKLIEATNAVILTLPALEQHVITMRFGLLGSSEYSIEEIAKMLGISKTRVRNIETRSLRLLRHPTRLRKLNLEKVSATFEQIRQNELSTEDAIKIINEELPELSSFTDLFPKTRMELYTFLGALFVLIGIIVNTYSPKDNKTTVNQPITNYVTNVTVETPKENKVVLEKSKPEENLKSSKSKQK